MTWWLVVIASMASFAPLPYSSEKECLAARDILRKQMNVFVVAVACLPAPLGK